MSDSCFYCTKEAPLYDLMIEICELSVSKLFLFREQTYYGRCNVVLKEHLGDLHTLDEELRNAFFKDVAQAANAMAKVFSPDKINYGAYADKMQHFHMHLVPKYEGKEGFGGVFEMNPQKTYLTGEEYAEMIKKLKENL